MTARVTARRSHTVSVEAVAALLAMLAVAFGAPTIAGNFTLADVFIGVVLLFLLSSALADSTSIQHEIRHLFLPIVLIFTGSLIASTYVGLQSWIILDLVKDAGALLSFFAFVHALRRFPPRTLRYASHAIAIGTVALTLQLLGDSDPETRGSASFSNPNIPGHYLATAIGVLAITLRGWPRLATVAMGFVGLLATGSFGAAFQLTAMIAYVVFSHREAVMAAMRKRRTVVLGATFLVIAAGVAFVLFAAASDPSRFGRSSSGRLDLWGDALEIVAEHPLGVGPGSVAELSLLNLGREPHSEFVAYITERGPIAFLGLLGLGFGLFRLGRRGSGVRMLVVGFATASMFRETLHYRHIWLFLALVLVWEETRYHQEDDSLRGVAESSVVG